MKHIIIKRHAAIALLSLAVISCGGGGGTDIAAIDQSFSQQGDPFDPRGNGYSQPKKKKTVNNFNSYTNNGY